MESETRFWILKLFYDGKSTKNEKMGLREEKERMKQQRISELARWAQQWFKFATSGPPQDVVLAEATRRWDIPSSDAREYAKNVRLRFKRS